MPTPGRRRPYSPLPLLLLLAVVAMALLAGTASASPTRPSVGFVPLPCAACRPLPAGGPWSRRPPAGMEHRQDTSAAAAVALARSRRQDRALLVRPAALPPTLLQDVGGAALVAGAAGVWLKLWTTLATAGKVDSKDSRKIIHCGSGPLFLLCWPFFSADPSARFLAAAVPLLQMIAVTAAGLAKSNKGSAQGGSSSSSNGVEGASSTSTSSTSSSSAKPDGLVAAISRSGNPAEVLRGPLIYVVVLFVATLACWRTSPVGLVAVAQMAAGDGMADIVGRRLGKYTGKWPFSATKSYAGTAAFVVFGFLVSVGLLAWFHFWGLVPALTLDAVLRVAAISVACALVELVPLGDDNVTVPAVAALLSMLLLQ